MLFGPYRTPRARVGARVICKIRGPSVVVGFSQGPIKWPLGRVPGNKQTMLIIYGDLEKALRREAAIAVRYWWGTSSAPVVRWRKQLNVGMTEGTATSRGDALNRVHRQRTIAWTAAEDAIVRKCHCALAAKKLGKSRRAVYVRRHKLGLPDARRSEHLSAAHRRGK